MSNVIDFLETMGQDAQLRHASSSIIETALVAKQVDERIRTAILSKDQHQLEQLLGADTNVCCIVAAEENDTEVQALSTRAVG